MTFKKGMPRPPGAGRRPGSPNKATAQAKEAIARFVDGNAERLQRWLDEIEREEGAKEAFRCFSDLLEYHVPKLTRAEVTGGDGGPLVVEIVDPTRRATAK